MAEWASGSGEANQTNDDEDGDLADETRDSLLTRVVGFGFLVTELLRSKGVKLKEGVATHRNAYLLQTKLHEPKGKGVTLKKKVVVEESSSNVPLTDVVKTANAKCKLDVEGKSQSKTVPKVPMVSLQSKANGKAVEKSEKSKKKAAKKSPTEVECTILSLQKACFILLIFVSCNVSIFCSIL
nr:uncharacterized protein LOC109167327 [Ipomoea batatas]